jgi:thiol:disulfide interchange protein DsbC
MRRFRKVPRALAAAALSLFTLSGHAANADAEADRLKSTLQARLGAAAQVKSVARSPMPGVFEVVVGPDIVYSDAKGQYLLLGGNMIETATHKNLTEARLDEVNKVDFASLPLSGAIKVVKGTGARRMVVFSDPNCPYCRRLEQTVKQLDNVTIYTFLYPILSEDSTAKARAIWCSPDRAQTWEAWMLDKKTPAAAACDSSTVDRNVALGRSLNITGTPTVILANGRRLPGAVPLEQLEKELATAS